ncbi:MAG: TonB family protein [Lysobacterales bacterium]|jgi:TonB family protein
MNFLSRNKLFIATLGFSASIHGSFLVGSMFTPTAPNFSVVQAPNTVAVNLVERVVLKPDPVKIIEPIEEVITVENQEVEQEIIIEKEPEPIIEEVKPEEVFEESQEAIKSIESMGALADANPLEHLNKAPSYPRLAQQRGWEGTVVLDVVVDAQGFAESISINTSSGRSILDKAALRAVGKWQFEAARSGDKAFESSIKVPVEFRLIK